MGIFSSLSSVFTDAEQKDRSVVDWRKCDSEQIWNDIEFAVGELQRRFMCVFNPATDPFTIQITPDNYKCLSKKDDMGNEVRHYFWTNWRNVIVAEDSPLREKGFFVMATKDGHTYKVTGLRVYRE